MSILASLNSAYERFASKNEIASFGFATQSIHCCIVIDAEGKQVGPPVLWHKNEKGKPSARSEIVPYFGGRSGQNAPPYFLWDNTAYVLGVSAKEAFDAGKRFLDFKNYHLSALDGANDDGLLAVAKFLTNWNPSDFSIAGFPDDVRDRNIIFRLESDKIFLHERPAAISLWQKIYKPDTIGEAVCLISGERAEIARLHPPIISFDNPARIVSFDKDNDAFSSYGHSQAENAPTGIKAAFAYTAVINKFLASKSKNRVQLGDASTVFWADASDAEVVNEAESLFGSLFNDVDETMQSDKVGVLLSKMRSGLPIKDFAPELEKGVRFYILGLAPNAARISIRFYFEDDFGTLAANYQRFIQDMRIEPEPHEGFPPFRKYLAETAVLGKRENVPPKLAGDWMRAILTGRPYPLTLMSSVQMRIRADKDINALRIAMLKSVLIRNYKMEVPVALDTENRNKGYLLGRLFAAYEQAQRAALGDKVNATIKDKFYGTASAQPRRVFALLDKGSVNHLSKLGKAKPGYRVLIEREIADIMGIMQPGEDPFPASMSAEEQALFGVGYYHQRNQFFKPKKAETLAIEDAK